VSRRRARVARPGASRHPLAMATCRHGGEAGRLSNGEPRCPICRRDAADRQTEPPPREDYAMRAAADDTFTD